MLISLYLYIMLKVSFDPMQPSFYPQLARIVKEGIGRIDEKPVRSPAIESRT